MRKIFLIMALSIATTSIGILSFSPLTITSASDWKPVDYPSKYIPGPGYPMRDDFFDAICETNTQLDCTESVAAFIDGEWVQGTLTGRTAPYPGGICCIEWKIPGLLNEDGTDLVMSRNLIKYTGNIFNSVEIHATTADGFRVPWESGRTDCTTNKVNGVCVREGHLQAGVKFRMTIRSSWVLPTAITGSLKDMKATVEYLPQSGATRVTFEGTPSYIMGIASETEITDENGHGSWDILTFGGSVVDGRFYPIKKECIEKPTILVTANGYGGSLPSFNNGQLDLKIGAPHFRPDKKTVHYGNYEATVPLSTAVCLWGTSIQSASQLKVEIFETASGETKTSSSSVSLTDENVVIRASGFTFSNPTIRVLLAPNAVATTTTSSTTTTAPVVTTTSTTTAPAVPVTAAPVTKATGVTTKIKKSVTGSNLAKTVGLSVPKKSKISLSIAAKYAKKCAVAGTSVKTLAKGTCVVKVTVTTATKKKTSQNVTITVK